MSERLSDHSREMMAFAVDEARRYRHEYVGTEHLLLGLLKTGECGGATVLRALGADGEKIRRDVESLLKVGPDEIRIVGSVPLRPRSKRVIELAVEETRAMEQKRVGTEHLLLAMLRERDGVAAQVLMNAGLTVDGVRHEVLRISRNMPEADIAVMQLREIEMLRATKTWSRAIRCAKKEGRESAGTGDLLLAMFEEKESIAARALAGLGVTEENLRAHLQRFIADEQAPPPPMQSP